MAFRQIKTPAIANAAVTNAKLDANSVEGQSALSGADSANDAILVYDASATALVKMTPANFVGSMTTDNLPEGKLSDPTLSDQIFYFVYVS